MFTLFFTIFVSNGSCVDTRFFTTFYTYVIAILLERSKVHFLILSLYYWCMDDLHIFVISSSCVRFMNENLLVRKSNRI